LIICSDGGIAGFVFYLSGFVGKMFWWIVLFAIRGILVFERFASRGVILGKWRNSEKIAFAEEQIKVD
jgi:hypothetical protein